MQWTYLARLVLALAMVSSGLLHLFKPRPFIRIVPGFLPFPQALVLVSGIAEIVGGIGLLIPRTRDMAVYGLIALLIAVFPANINMALQPNRWVRPKNRWLLYARLPLQLLLILWAWVCLS